MERPKAGRNAEAGGSRGVATGGTAARKVRKKPKTPQLPPSPKPSGPIPAPYLAVAPLPVSSLSSSRIDELAGTTRSNMILPSSFVRNSQTSSPGPSNLDSAPTTTIRQPEARRQKYAAGLLAPPAIMPGGSSAAPRVQGSLAPPQNMRRRSAERVGVGGSSSPVIMVAGGSGRGYSRQRSEERLRDIGMVNTSIVSLGQLGQILESDPVNNTETRRASVPNNQARRRRRIVRGETVEGLQRRPTVTSREEGRALGLARGASMRRLNVWDDVPEAADPPPAFPFPTSSSNRLPPAFEAEETVPDPTQPTSGQTTPLAHLGNGRPRSPPPSFEQAIGLAPLSAPLSLPTTPSPNTPRIPLPSPSPPMTPRLRTPLTLATSLPLVAASTTSSPTASNYASAPSSPIDSEMSHEEVVQDDRDDRKAWNADILAGYSLEDRVWREAERRGTVVQIVLRERIQREEGPESIQEAAIPEQTTREPSAQASSTDHRILQEEHAQERHSGEEAGGSDQSRRSSVVPIKLAPAIPRQPEQPEAAVHEELTGHLEEVPTPVGRRDSELDTAHSGNAAQTQEFTVGQALEPVQSELQGSGTAFMASVEETSATVTEPVKSPDKNDVPISPNAESGSSAIAITLPEGDTRTSKMESTEQISTFTQPPDSPQTPRASDTVPSFTEEPLASSGQITPSDTQSRAGSDRIISKSPPGRKLTRGKAVRRLSSKTSPLKSGSIRSKRLSDPPKPLFSRPAYTAAELLAGAEAAEPVKVNFVHRLSEPSISNNIVKEATPGDMEEKPPARDRIQSQPNVIINETSHGPAILPHREAALRRRDFPLAKKEQIQRDPLPQPVSPKSPVRRSLVPSGPLIDLNDEWPMSNISPRTELRALAASTAELLQLLEDDPLGPVAESSAQGAAKAAVVQAVSDEFANANVVQEGETPASAVAPQKKAPAPPPPLRSREESDGEGVKRKKSVLSTANSPITPYIPSTRISEAPVTPSRPPPLPTRRPPPPPPVTSVFVEHTETVTPNHAPPAFESQRPPPLRTDSSMTATSSVSSMSEKVPEMVKPPLPWRLRPRTSLGARPRGPRPPPIPPRPWAKVVTSSLDERPMPRPLGDRTMSENPIVVPELMPTSPTRSVSVQDLRSEPRSPVEYTDLDVLVSRLESSGREYEGFAQITSFLGPAKNPAATPEALATLLPGPVLVDSRRTNSAGKVKLKLSLLGVRITKCPICLGQFREKDTAVMLPDCGHIAHEACATRWFREDSKCFVCRVPLRAEEGVI